MSRRGAAPGGDDPADANDLLAGRYRLGDPQAPAHELFATRFAAHDELLDRPVDVLLLHDGMLADPVATALFAAGVAAPARLTHAAALGIFDAGTGEFRGRTVRWAVREPLRGKSVDGFARDAAVTAADGSRLVVDVARHVAELLQLLHDQGMTHGNLGPSTIVVASAPGHATRVKVVGFGPQASDLARADAGVSPTRLLERFGESVRYPAPERRNGAAPRAADDVYGFGVMLDTLLLVVDDGERGAGRHDTFDAQEPDDGEATVPSAPGALLRRLGRIAAIARAEDPSDRFASAGELQSAVIEAIGPGGLLGVPEADSLGGFEAVSAASAHSGVAHSGAAHHLAADRTPTEAIATVRRGKLERRIATATALQHELTRELPRRRRRRAATRGTALALASAATIAVLTWSAITSFGPTASSAIREGVVLPTVAGQSVDEATRLLVDAGVSPAGQRSEADPAAPDGQVIGTDPAAGTTLGVDAPVTLIVSSGPDLAAVPSLTGRAVSDAEALLKASGLVLGEIRKRDGVDAAGTVLATTPVAGTDAPAGSTVALTVASGRSTVPDGLPGLAPDDAAARLEALGFSVRFRQEPRDDQPPGSVAATNPAAGTSAPHGTVVSVTVAVAVPPAAPPSTSGPGNATSSPSPTAVPPRPTTAPTPARPPAPASPRPATPERKPVAE
ncbi:PASTA domain-containing protein [Okibacterium fritillariae]|uniref:PASTA domain-containing protein n=1 Tax=Okibacterium fritillariae TaxID=123320 RepID=UPI00405582C0